MLRLSTSSWINSPCRCVSHVSPQTIELENVIKSKKIQPKSNESGTEEINCEPPQSFKNVFKVFNSDSPRYNDFNIQMISKAMCDHLFGKNSKINPKNRQELTKAMSELKNHGLMSNVNEVPEVSINLPKLEGETIVDHFYTIGEHQCAPYRNLTKELITELPAVPTFWEMKAGWTKYTKEGFCSIDFPDEDALVFDVEVCCSEGPMPTIAVAAGHKAWFSWVSRDLVSDNKSPSNSYYTLEQLIPLESNDNQKGFRLSDNFKRPRIVVGHNVSYDRARIKEQYWIEKTGLRFLDTMSLHVAVSGVTSYQKNLLKAGLGKDDEWSKLSSLNSLSKVYNLYCGSELSKEQRDIFVTGTLSDVRNNFQSLMSYCAKDVTATHNVLCKLFPMYISRFPHPVSLAGILELGLAYLPVDGNWNQYIKMCNQTYADLECESKLILSQLADHACQLLHNEEYRKHLWLWDQDWSVRKLALKKTRMPSKKTSVIANNNSEIIDLNQIESNEIDDDCNENKILENKFKYLFSMNSLLPLRGPHLPGYPSWYTKLCPKLSSPDWAAGPQLLSTGMQIAPKLLSLTWKSMPLHYVQGHGWGMLVPFKTDIELDDAENVPLEQLVKHCQTVESDLFCNCTKHTTKEEQEVIFHCDKKKLKNNSDVDSVVYCKSEIGTECGLIKLPHKDGKHLNVGNPLARDYIHKFSDEGLGSGNLKTQRLIEISRMLSYWRNNRERVENQVIVWLKKRDIPYFKASDNNIGAILPQVVVCGTLTRRAVEPTWMTASNALGERVGSELRSMIKAPPSYCIVGADVDSQELWIASVIGDAYSYNEHGATPFGWMTLNGQKSDNTDMHSVTAKAVGISRHQAKVINYARIYGAGQRFAEHLLKQFNPNMSPSEAKQKASKMFSITKGKRCYILKKTAFQNIKQRIYTKYSAKELCFLHGKSVDEIFEKPRWIGGTESAMFNRLEEIASTIEPKTPFLKGRLSRALEPGTDSDDKFNPTRVNWVVQSGAVDFLHLMLVCMRWLMGPEARFCLSFHDEVRYLVPSSQRYQTALALHITNLYTRAFCISQLGMRDVPRSVAFFTSVEVDTVLRKESDSDCKTPSNPFGLSKGYGIPNGESLTVEDAIKKAKGVVGVPSYRKKRILK